MGVQSGKRGRKNLRMRRTILLSTTVGMIFAAPQSNPVWTEVIGEYKGEPLKVVRPTTEAALAFMKDFFGEDLCSSAAQAYMESVLSGESGAKASEAAEIAFIDQAVEDGNAVADPVCSAATIAFLDAKIAKSSDKEASAAAADAYIEANAANGGKRSEACRKAAEAYIKLL